MTLTRNDERRLTRHLLVDFAAMQEFARDPLVLEEGRGIRVRDSEGRWYIDGMSGVFVSSLGHANKVMVDAVAEQAGRLAFGAPLSSANGPTLQLVERLLELVPDAYEAVKLTAAGSEATEAAIKMARQYHSLNGRGGRFKVLSHYRSFHGATGHALAASGGVRWRSAGEPLAGGFVHVHPPFVLAQRLGLDPDRAVDAALALVAETIELEGPDTVAAFITEPLWLSAGVHIPSPRYLQGLSELCERHDIVLIFDEIITGFGRTGRLLCAEHSQVLPHILCFGKGISGGYAPLAGMLVSGGIAQTFWGPPGEPRAFLDGHTYGNNPIASAAGLAALEQLVDGGVIANAARQGAALSEQLRAVDLPAVVEVRALGLLIGLQLAADGPTGKAVAAAAQARGLIIRPGPDFVALGPPLVVTEDDVAEIAGIVMESVAAAALHP